MRKNDQAVAEALVALASVVPPKELPAICDKALAILEESGSRDLHSFVRTVKKALEKSGQVVFATLITPTGASSAERKKSIALMLEKRLQKPIVLIDQADPSLLGGARLKVGDDLYELTLAGELKELTRI
jgi:F0F1-type ATP synthase delta subunit